MINNRIPLLAAMTLSLCALALPVRADDNNEGNKKGEDQSKRAYLAMGDSVPFGFTPIVPLGDLSAYNGFPKIVAQLTDTALTNSSCPYETTGTLLAQSPDKPCPWFLGGGPLFVNYGTSNGSQMGFAVKFLTQNKVKLVTIMIGGNDLAPVLTCTTQQCIMGVLGTVIPAVTNHLNEVFAGIHNTGYKGPIVAVNYYGLNYKDPASTYVFSQLNAAIAQAAGLHPNFHVKIADAFGAFAAASVTSGGNPCVAGLLVQTGGTPTAPTCDIHPSPYGQTILAGAVMAALGNDDHQE